VFSGTYGEEHSHICKNVAATAGLICAKCVPIEMWDRWRWCTNDPEVFVSWSARFHEPIPLPGGGNLTTPAGRRLVHHHPAYTRLSE
jgi:hypothetical protein